MAQPTPDEPEVVKMLSKVIEGWKKCAAQWDDEGDSPRASDYTDCADELEEFLKWYRKPDGHFPKVAAAQEQKPYGYMIPKIVTLENSKHHSVDAHQFEGEVYWEYSTIGDANPKTDKHGMAHHPFPVYRASPAPAHGWVKMDNPDYAQYLRKDWVMVPREPTEAMLEAARMVRMLREDDGDPQTLDSNSENTWAAMLAAAPKGETE